MLPIDSTYLVIVPRSPSLTTMPTLRRFSTVTVVAMIGALSACSVTAPDDEGPQVGTFRSDTTTLAFVLDRPNGSGPFPVVVMVHGSGRTTRDEMLNLVPQFTARGFAVFRYDKRGVGESGGTYRGVSVVSSLTVIPELARDAAAALATACGSRRIDATRCGFFGASQAGWIIPEALMLTRSAAFAILFSGVADPVGVEIYYERLATQPTVSLDSAYAALPHFAGDRGYDPRATLAAMTTPTLWLLGMEDLLVPNRLAVPHLESLRSAGLPVTVRAYPTYGHALGPDVWPDIDLFLSPFGQQRHSLSAAGY